MLKKLIVDFFQSHKHTVVEFHPGVNVILGDNRAGKTALFRAFGWLANNRPLGFRFHSRFAGRGEKTSVEAVFSDCAVKFSRGKSGMAEYSIDGGEPFSGLAKGVPDKVRDALNLSDMNIQKQVGDPFLITATPGEAARVINKVARMDEADKWVSGLTTKVNTKNKTLMHLKEQIAVREDQLEQYQNLAEIGEKVARLVSLEERLEDIEKSQEALNDLAERHKTTKARLSDHQSWISVVEDVVREAEADLDAINNINIDIDALSSLVRSHRAVEAGMTSAKRLLASEDKVEEAEEVVKQLLDLRGQAASLGGVLQRHKAAKIRLDSAVIRREESRKGLHKTLTELGLCPLCFSTLDEEQIQKVLEGI